MKTVIFSEDNANSAVLVMSFDAPYRPEWGGIRNHGEQHGLVRLGFVGFFFLIFHTYQWGKL